MLRSMTIQQLKEWETFSQLEPFEAERWDYVAGNIIQVVANAFRNPRRSPFTLEECTPKFGDAVTPKKTWQQLKNIAKTIAAVFS